MDSIFKELSYRAVITDLHSIRKCYKYKVLDISVIALERINYIKEMKIPMQNLEMHYWTRN